MTTQITLCKPKLLRRTCAAILDLIIAVVVAVLISFIVTPIISKKDRYIENLTIYNDYAVESGLYRYTDESKSKITEAFSTDESGNIHFYENYVEDGLNKYKQIKIESELFDYDEETDTFKVKDGISKESINAFNAKNRDDAIFYYFDNYIKSNEVSNKASNILAAYYLIELFICASLALLVVYVIEPLIVKNGTSLGKFMFKLKIVSTKGKLQVSRLQLLFRGLTTVLLEFLVSIYFIGVIFIPFSLILSLVIMFLSKKQLAIHDLVCSTLVIDDSGSNIIKESDKIVLNVVE